MEKKSVSVNTASRWLNILGYTFKQNRQDIYYDGQKDQMLLNIEKNFWKKYLIMKSI